MRKGPIKSYWCLREKVCILINSPNSKWPTNTIGVFLIFLVYIKTSPRCETPLLHFLFIVEVYMKMVMVMVMVRNYMMMVMVVVLVIVVMCATIALADRSKSEGKGEGKGLWLVRYPDSFPDFSHRSFSQQHFPIDHFLSGNHIWTYSHWQTPNLLEIFTRKSRSSTLKSMLLPIFIKETLLLSYSLIRMGNVFVHINGDRFHASKNEKKKLLKP